MSDTSLKESKKSEHVESNASNENESEESDESEEKVEDNINKNNKKNKDVYINSYDQHSTEEKNSIKTENKNTNYFDKEVQASKIIITQNQNINIIQKQNEFYIKAIKDKRIKEYQEKIKRLKNESKFVDEKDKTIQQLTKLNLKLKNSLELISKQMDEKFNNINLIKNKNKNNNHLRLLNNLSSDNDLHKKSLSDKIIKEKELNNAINIIKILRFDNQRLQNKIDEIEQNKEIEKQTLDKNQILMQKELQEHKLCKQKMESYQEKIKKLAEKNKTLMDKLIYGKAKNGNKTNINNRYIEFNESEDENGGNFYKIKKKLNNFSPNRINKKGNFFNLRKLGDSQKYNSLPKLNYGNNNHQLNSSKNNNNY